MDVEDFSEEAYLERYPDVAQAIALGDIASGRTHFNLYGRAEGRLGTAILIPERVDLDPASCIMKIPSPALATTPPVVINLEKIPDALRSMYESMWREERPAREIACHRLHDVIVVGDGLVFDAAGRLVAASAHQTSKRQIEQGAIKVRDFLAGGGGTAVGGTTLLCEKIGVVNYFHWLIEMAPIAFLLRDQLKADWFLRAPLIEGDPGLSAVVRDTLELLGIHPARIHWGTGAMPQRHEHLILTHGFSHHGAAYSPLASAALREMATRVPADKRSRIWVSRAGLRRRMQDENGICEALAAKGWTTVSPGTMSLRRQIALFKDAEVVAGVNGAGLTNFGFSPSSTRVVAFAPARLPDISFWMLAQMKEQTYTEIRCCQEHSHAGAFNWEGMLMMETTEALAHIDAILAI